MLLLRLLSPLLRLSSRAVLCLLRLTPLLGSGGGLLLGLRLRSCKRCCLSCGSLRLSDRRLRLNLRRNRCLGGSGCCRLVHGCGGGKLSLWRCKRCCRLLGLRCRLGRSGYHWSCCSGGRRSLRLRLCNRHRSLDSRLCCFRLSSRGSRWSLCSSGHCRLECRSCLLLRLRCWCSGRCLGLCSYRLSRTCWCNRGLTA